MTQKLQGKKKKQRKGKERGCDDENKDFAVIKTFNKKKLSSHNKAK